MQVDVFAYEYSGYGHATGKPCEENLYSDARAALACLRDGFKLKPERDIVLYGATPPLPPPRLAQPRPAPAGDSFCRVASPLSTHCSPIAAAPFTCRRPACSRQANHSARAPPATWRAAAPCAA